MWLFDHQFAGLVVLLQQQFLGHLDGAQIFAHDVPAAAIDHFAHPALGGFHLLDRDIAQGLDLGMVALENLPRLPRIACGGCAYSLSPSSCLTMLLTIDHAQLLGFSGTNCLVRSRQSSIIACPARAAVDDHLVHDPAGNRGVFVLGLLADQGQPIRVHLQTAPAEAGPARDGNFDGRAAGKSAADRQRIGDQCVHSRQRDARRDQFRRHAAEIIPPGRLAALDLLLQGELDEFVGINRRGDFDDLVLAAAADDRHLRLDGHGKDESVVVIRVFADEIDAPGARNDPNFASVAEKLGETVL